MPAGYEALAQRYDLEVIPNWRRSFIAKTNTHKTDMKDGVIEEVFPSRYYPGDETGDHLEFALKYDGTNLAILAALFRIIPETDFLKYLRSKRTGKYSRRLWFLYEFLTKKILPIDDLHYGNYVNLLEPEEYYTISPSSKSSRHRINNNLPGNRLFCPLVRRTETLCEFEKTDFRKKFERVASGYSRDVFNRALGYLYLKETKSSFEIEHIQPSSKRTEKFISLLRLAEEEDFCGKDNLIRIQNRIVEERFQEKDYRTNQNYVGETVSQGEERIHYVSPKPEVLPGMMKGLIGVHQLYKKSPLHPIIHAGIISWGFVFLHPFEDGNGRIHRFLIHNILATKDFTPRGVLFPVSACMLKNPEDYNASLESFSLPLKPLVEYTLDNEGRMTVHNDTEIWYRYIDMTLQVEALYKFIDRTIAEELSEEMSFLASYDEAKKAIREIVDMPDRKIDLFIKFCLQNNGRLSSRKRNANFDFLSEEEISGMEKAAQTAFSAGKQRNGK